MFLVTAFLLLLPVGSIYFAHYRKAKLTGESATGFIQLDMPYYMANARQYYEGESSGLFYSNPYDYHRDSPKIYWQPLILIWGGLLRLFPDAPGGCFLFVGLVFAVLSMLRLIQLLGQMFPAQWLYEKTILLVTLAWGGGFLASAAILQCYRKGMSLNLFLYDPDQGLWFLNLGRNFIYPTEAVYHFLMLSLFWSVLKRRKAAIVIWTWLLVLSHPFTGLQYALIAFGWAIFERQFLNSKLFAWGDVAVLLTPLLYIFGYYLVYLPSHPSHAVLAEFWKIDWSIKFSTIVLAYGLFGFLVLYRCCTKERFLNCFSDPFNRFLAFAFVISFVLANHEAFFQPHQPVHFTRGHLWTPLCLLSLPVLQQFLTSLRPHKISLAICTGLWLGLALFDNAAFFVYRWCEPTGFFLDDAERSVFQFINKKSVAPILLSNEKDLAYLSATYSDARPYLGHYANTPYTLEKAERQEQFFQQKIIPPELEQENFWVLTREYAQQFRDDARFVSIFRENQLELFEYVDH